MEKSQKDRLCDVLEQMACEMGALREDGAKILAKLETLERAVGPLHDAIERHIVHTFETVNKHGREIRAIRQHLGMETGNGAAE